MKGLSFGFKMSTATKDIGLHPFDVRSLNGDRDTYFFGLYFREHPLELVAAKRAHLELEIRITNGSQPVEAVVVPLMEDSESELVELLSGELKYRVMRCHQMWLNPAGTHIKAVYFSIADVSTVEGPPQFALLERELPHPQVQALAWFPPDLNPAVNGMRVNPSTIAQRTPLWWTFRGAMSGSRAYSILGWFAGESEPTESAKANMRLGTYSERTILETYLKAHPTRRFQEVGWCPAKAYPGWGASPDGVVCEGEQQQQQQQRCWPIEFKTSRYKMSMEGYFIPQLYMEMLVVGNTQQAELVRYCTTKQQMHVYLLERDADLERRLVYLWRQALRATEGEVKQLQRSIAFLAMRAECDAMARSMQPIQVLSGQHGSQDFI